MKAGTNQRILNSQEGRRPRKLHPVRLTLRIATGFLIAAGLHCTSVASTLAAEPIPTIRIAVLNFTEATPQTVATAEREAGRIFSDAVERGLGELSTGGHGSRPYRPVSTAAWTLTHICTVAWSDSARFSR